MAQSLKVWSKFSVTKETNTFKFRIVEAPQELVEDITEFIVTHFLMEESIAKATGVTKSEEAISIYRTILSTSLKFPGVHMLVCCLDNDSDEIGEILGGAFMWLIEDDDPIKIQLDSKELMKFFQVINATSTWYHTLAEQKVSKYYDGRIVVVHKDYRGMGIAQELFRIMPQICKEDNVPLTTGLMTAYGSQKAAKRAGWETVFEFSFEEIGKKLGVTFTEDTPPMAKLMMAREQNRS